MSALTIEELPTLTNPALIVAFAGWNDAGSAATHAAQFLVQRLQARRFANLDPEEFYNFSELAPAAPRWSVSRSDLADQRFSLQPFCYLSGVP